MLELIGGDMILLNFELVNTHDGSHCQDKLLIGLQAITC